MENELGGGNEWIVWDECWIATVRKYVSLSTWMDLVFTSCLQ